jgi:16S rRNA U516 pseudouridylate synthase RsuA-like enzyme
MVHSQTKRKPKLITKKKLINLRVEEGWKRKVKSISESIGVSTSVFIRESVNKNIESLRM